MPLNPKCKHDNKFYCDWVMEVGTYQFLCGNGCGFYMEYNPQLYPEGVYFPECPELKGKLLPPLTSNEVPE